MFTIMCNDDIDNHHESNGPANGPEIILFLLMAAPVLLVKNMVCHRCVLSVEEVLRQSDIPFDQVLVGEIHLQEGISENQKSALAGALQKIGLELIDNRMSGLIEKIKHLIQLKARNETDEKDRQLKLSAFLSGSLHHEYSHLSNLFSQIEGRTIENYFIEQRIEKAKELLVYGQLTLAEIAFALDYSSSAHLSSQFKKVTGLTPSHFKGIGTARRKALDQV